MQKKKLPIINQKLLNQTPYQFFYKPFVYFYLIEKSVIFFVDKQMG